MAKTSDVQSRSRALLAVPTLRSKGQARRAQDLEDAAERAEQLADASAGEVKRDRWPGSRWTHRGERVTIRIVAGPQLRDGVPSVKIRDGRALRWEPIAFILEGFERVGAEAAPDC